MTFNIRNHRNIVVFTGAGISKESGIPTYRGPGGVWTKYDYESVACERAFQRDPERVWEFNNQRRETVGACKPNRAHEILAEMQRELDNLTIVTQNIDGLHQAAGAKDVIELHGSLWRVRDADGEVQVIRDPVVLEDPKDAQGRWLRPDIVWFGDPLRQRDIALAAEAVQGCDLFIAIGTSGSVTPAAHLPAMAAQLGKMTMEINVEDTMLSPIFHLTPRGSAATILEEIWSR